MAGRRPKPTAIKEMAGNPGKRPLNKREPKPRVAIPSCPKWLTAEARTEYRKMARLLVGVRVLTEADQSALVAYATEYARWVEANRMIAEAGMVLRNNMSGTFYQNPYITVANNALKNMKAFMVEFGLTPASRSKIQAMPEEEKDLATALFEHVVEDA